MVPRSSADARSAFMYLKLYSLLLKVHDTMFLCMPCLIPLLLLLLLKLQLASLLGSVQTVEVLLSSVPELTTHMVQV